MKARQINDDNTLSYLFKKVEAKVEAGLQSLKDYLVALINGKVSKSGDTMTGRLVVSNVNDRQVAVKNNNVDTTLTLLFLTATCLSFT